MKSGKLKLFLFCLLCLACKHPGKSDDEKSQKTFKVGLVRFKNNQFYTKVGKKIKRQKDELKKIQNFNHVKILKMRSWDSDFIIKMVSTLKTYTGTLFLVNFLLKW